MTSENSACHVFFNVFCNYTSFTEPNDAYNPKYFTI